MIAAASPGDSENDTSDSTANGPRAVGYSLLRLVTCSKTVPRGRRPRDQGIVHLEQAIGGSLNTVVLPHAAEAALAEAVGERRILIERVQAVRQRGWIVGSHQQTAAGLLDDLGKGAAARLHHGHAAGHRFE